MIAERQMRKSGKVNEMIYIKKYKSPIGMLTLASDGSALVGLWMEGQKYEQATIKEEKKKMISEMSKDKVNSKADSICIQNSKSSDKKSLKDKHSDDESPDSNFLDDESLDNRSLEDKSLDEIFSDDESSEDYMFNCSSDDLISATVQDLFAVAEDWLDRYFAGEQPNPTELNLAPKGSVFRQRVWKKLLEIPYGSTTTYGQIAAQLRQENENAAKSASSPEKETVAKSASLSNSKTVTKSAAEAEIDNKKTVTGVSAQAVGGAVGHNPISIIIPCHRVLGADGSLTGYAGGIDKKEYLLKLEGVTIPS